MNRSRRGDRIRMFSKNSLTVILVPLLFVEEFKKIFLTG